MLRLSAFVSLLLLTLSQSLVRASPCLSFDVDFNLLAFGFNGKDWNAGTQDVWATGRSPPLLFSGCVGQTSNFTSCLTLTSLTATNPTDITTTGRPSVFHLLFVIA